MRDFSPQMGRGVAMGFWALGPTMGALCASLVATHTLDHLTPWQDQFIISGVVCMVVVVISFFFLRELSPQLRDQLMVSERERALVEARAQGIDVEKATQHPIRSMMKIDLVASSIAISLFLLFYYASVSVLTIYWVVTFNRSTPDANGINVWSAAFLSAGLVVAGVLSDWAKVRKPFMLFGAVCAMVMMAVLIRQTGHPHTGYYANVLVIVPLAVSSSIAYTPWMANYTEQVESHNPARRRRAWPCGAGSCASRSPCRSSSCPTSSRRRRCSLTTRPRAPRCRPSRRLSPTRLRHRPPPARRSRRR